MADERAPERRNIHLMPLPARSRRRELPPLLRRAIIAVCGALIGIASFYLLRSIGR